MAKRRDFLKLAGAISAGAVFSGSASSCSTQTDAMKFENTYKEVYKNRTQRFNMSGYAAPPLETVRIGFIGLGHRGPSSLRRLSLIEGVEIKALCDIRPERLEVGQKYWSIRECLRPENMEKMKMTGKGCARARILI